MLSHINIYNLIFIDIETVPQFASFQQLSATMQELWAIKHATLKIENENISKVKRITHKVLPCQTKIGRQW